MKTIMSEETNDIRVAVNFEIISGYIKVCGYCGSRPSLVIEIDYDTNERYYCVDCVSENCPHQPTAGTYLTKEEAIEA